MAPRGTSVAPRGMRMAPEGTTLAPRGTTLVPRKSSVSPRETYQQKGTKRGRSRPASLPRSTGWHPNCGMLGENMLMSAYMKM